jgi:hypothetical protein
MNKSIIIVLSAFLIVACSKSKDEPIGKWDDIIKLSTKNVEFSANADSVKITTKGDWWWINAIGMGDKIYTLYNREDINLESNSYVIKEDCFVVAKIDKNTIFVKMSKNETGNERILKISLEAGDYFDGLSVKQAANR